MAEMFRHKKFVITVIGIVVLCVLCVSRVDKQMIEWIGKMIIGLVGSFNVGQGIADFHKNK